MKIIVAPDKFKGSLSSKAAAAAIGRGLAKAAPKASIKTVPLADGGEGTVDTLIDYIGGEAVTSIVIDPLGRPVEAVWAVGNSADGIRTAIIEMSAASGLKLVGRDNRPLEATTYGTGELISAALDGECQRIIIGIGGSATTDGGAGMAEALGVRFLTAGSEKLGRGGGALARLTSIDLSGLDKRIGNVEIIVACDVDNPLCGPNGAALVYGPQKGVSEEEKTILDDNLRHFAWIVNKELGIDLADMKGTGAAGGLGGGLVAFAGGKLKPGFDLISEAVGLPDILNDADLIVTGEGRIDGQTGRGKVPGGVAALAADKGVPAVAVAGSIGPGVEAAYECGLAAVEPICAKPMTLEEATENAAALVEAAAERMMRAMLAGRSLPRS